MTHDTYSARRRAYQARLRKLGATEHTIVSGYSDECCPCGWPFDPGDKVILTEDSVYCCVSHAETYS